MKLKDLFTPLNKDYCYYFYYLSIFFFALFVVCLIFVIISLCYPNPNTPISFIEYFVVLSNPVLLYFVNRLYYSICINSLQ